MAKYRGDSRATGAAKTALATLSPSRIVAVAFLASVSLPIGWGIAYSFGRRAYRASDRKLADCAGDD
jgi:hypothetical protein